MGTLREVRFAFAEKLPQSLKDKSPKTTGLVAIRVSIDSPPEITIDDVSIDPIDYLTKLGEEECISQELVNQGIQAGFGDED